MKALILAGGLGTRLRSVVTECPKPMALIDDVPFLAVLIKNLGAQGVAEVTLSVGYKHEVIEEYFGEHFKNVAINYVREDAPLGTGGALKLAMKDFSPHEDVFVLNGDTFLDIDLVDYKQKYIASNADVGMALKPMSDAYRYGRVVLDDMGGIREFEEKGEHIDGLINAGVYIFRPELFNRFELPENFSLENDLFSINLGNIDFFSYVVDGYFIDIGIPEDYDRAQTELQSFM